jgi:adenylosuccinate synthase
MRRLAPQADTRSSYPCAVATDHAQQTRGKGETPFVSAIAVVGLGWGDEGKGKIVDAIAASRQARLVLRFNGGPNAGHTVVPEVNLDQLPVGTPAPPWHGNVFRLHQTPSGIFTPGCTSICGPGTVVDPDGFLAELAEIEALGGDTSRILLSDRAHIVLPAHRDRDALIEAARHASSPTLEQGTTRRGVGPCYEDRAGRIGLRLGDLTDRAYLDDHLPFLAAEQSRRLAAYGGRPVSLRDLQLTCERWASALRHRIVDSYLLVREALARHDVIVLEGQLGAGRDIDWGIYPYVTSSGTTAGAASANAGVPVNAITEVIGVAKAFATSVGSGPFVTEVHGDVAARFREAGGSETEHEYGVTTGRPRRCGWFDAVATRQAAQLNGVTGIALTKVDALDGVQGAGGPTRLRVAHAYELDGTIIDYVPSNTRAIGRVTPVYRDFAPWHTSSRNVRSWTQLPDGAKAYALAIQEACGTPVSYAGTGPGRLALAARC